MKNILFTLLFVFTLTSIVNAQVAHDLEIYSENGLNFTLILNGRTMNEIPANNVQITNTDKDYVNAKIIFENDGIPAIEKKFLQLAEPGQGNDKFPVSVVYKIIENKKGAQTLRFASRSRKKIQTTETIIIQHNYQPVNGRVIINW